MSAKHTPKPWRKARAKVGNDYAILDANNQIIAEVFERTGEATFQPVAANADLIVSAPDMADALEAQRLADHHRLDGKCAVCRNAELCIDWASLSNKARELRTSALRAAGRID